LEETGIQLAYELRRDVLLAVAHATGRYVVRMTHFCFRIALQLIAFHPIHLTRKIPTRATAAIYGLVFLPPRDGKRGESEFLDNWKIWNSPNLAPSGQYIVMRIVEMESSLSFI